MPREHWEKGLERGGAIESATLLVRLCLIITSEIIPLKSHKMTTQTWYEKGTQQWKWQTV